MTKIRFAVIAAICLLGASLASAQYVNPSAPNYGVNKMGQCYNSTLNNWVDVLPTTANYTVYPVQCDQYGNLTGVSAPAKISTSAITVNSLASGTDTTAGTASTTGGTMTASAYNYARIVAIDAAGNRMPVPPVVPETQDEKRRYEGAARRRETRRIESESRRQHRG